MEQLTFPIDPLNPGFGPCRTCQKTPATMLLLLAKEAPIPGTGWGCLDCDLPANGALAAVCDDCINQPIRWACLGSPNAGNRIAVAELKMPFGHKLKINPQIFNIKRHLSN